MLADGKVTAGTIWDRFGDNGGKWLSPAAENADFASRALPPTNLNNNQYRRFKWIKDYDVAGAGTIEESKVAAWFGQRGGATQFKTEKSVEELCIAGYLVYEDGTSCKPKP
ncbi:TNT domain-containing protein [Kitasatospora gansuensis]